MIRHAQAGAITAAALNVHQTPARTRLISGASLPLAAAPCLGGAGAAAIDLTAITASTHVRWSPATGAEEKPAAIGVFAAG